MMNIWKIYIKVVNGTIVIDRGFIKEDAAKQR